MASASNKKNKAFSFIEISIVLLILGVLIAITSQVRDLIHSAKIERARSLTQNSPILSIPDLAHWYEPVLQDSFETAIDVSGNIIEDGTPIKSWFDKNNSRLHPAHAIQNNSSYQPQYFNKVFDNTIPALRFFGSNDRLSSNNASIFGKKATYFVVAKRFQSVSFSGIFSIADSSSNSDYTSIKSFRAFYENNNLIQTLSNNIYGNSMTHPGNNIEYIASAIYDGSTVKSNINGGPYTTPKSVSPNFASTKIGIGCTFIGNPEPAHDCYNGYIAEIIIYNRALKSGEIKLIENYLRNKYNINLNN